MRPVLARVVAQVQHSSLDQSLVVFCVYHLLAQALLRRSIDGISFVCFAGSRFGVSSMASPRITPPDMSNFYCLPGRAGGTPMLLGSRSESKTYGAYGSRQANRDGSRADPLHLDRCIPRAKRLRRSAECYFSNQYSISYWSSVVPAFGSAVPDVRQPIFPCRR